jgi:hypothetical protein
MLQVLKTVLAPSLSPLAAAPLAHLHRTHMLLTDFINNGQSPGMAGVWRTTNGGATWSLKAQADWALDVRIDPGNPLRVFLGSSRSISNWGQGMPGQWGYGGFMYSTDGGACLQVGWGLVKFVLYCC